MRKLFHLPQFNLVDGLNDYDEDYTRFESLGGVVTHEMKRLMQREAQHLKDKLHDSRDSTTAPGDVNRLHANKHQSGKIQENEEANEKKAVSNASANDEMIEEDFDQDIEEDIKDGMMEQPVSDT